MSTTSTMTALAASDFIPSCVSNLSNHMCLFILTRSDGTLFRASSILEEDVIEICIQLGHMHPEGVLWYSAIESVMLFHTMEELHIAACGVVKAMMLHNESIRVRTSPPSATHVRAYMAEVNGEPSSIQHLQVNLGDLADNKLQQLMEELCREITLQELNAPPQKPTQTPREILWEMGILMWMTRRSSFWEGRVGSPRATISTSCPCTTRWRVGT